jgi:hypothetical protein
MNEMEELRRRALSSDAGRYHIEASARPEVVKLGERVTLEATFLERNTQSPGSAKPHDVSDPVAERVGSVASGEERVIGLKRIGEGVYRCEVIARSIGPHSYRIKEAPSMPSGELVEFDAVDDRIDQLLRGLREKLKNLFS